jgi:hypothetical protein
MWGVSHVVTLFSELTASDFVSRVEDSPPITKALKGSVQFQKRVLGEWREYAVNVIT